VRKLQNEHASQVEKLKQDDSVGNVAIIFDLFERPIKSVSSYRNTANMLPDTVTEKHYPLEHYGFFSVVVVY